jgi:hypothetical protein
MSGDLAQCGRTVVVAQTEPALHEQNRWKRARNQQQIIEPGMKENAVAMRLDQPPIGRIKQAANQAQRIEDIPKPPHNKARITKPAPKLSSTLSKTTFEKITREKYRTARLFVQLLVSNAVSG